MSMKKKAKLSSTKSSSTAPTVQYVICLIVLTILNVTVFYGFGGSTVKLACPTDTILQMVNLYTTNNAREPFNKLLPESCTRASDEAQTRFDSSLRQIVRECKSVAKMKKQWSNTSALVTLFTTHAAHQHDDAEQLLVHTNTLLNWASLKPRVNLILFSNESSWIKIAKKKGWKVIKTLADKDRGLPPVLKEMFQTAMHMYKTPWYGYVNADILFTRGLINTLEDLTHKYHINNSSIMLTGRRTNVDNLTVVDALSHDNLQKNAAEIGQLYSEDAEDYFITTGSFPWNRIIPVVIGRPGYDNWLVAEAKCLPNTTVIDVTDTITAIHQTTKKGNKEGHTHKDSDYNIDLFKHYNVTPNYMGGLTTCIPFRTYKTFCDNIEVEKRTGLVPICQCNTKR